VAVKGREEKRGNEKKGVRSEIGKEGGLRKGEWGMSDEAR
jgi:hypothetical protein